jgi:hypothetical protein
MTGIEGVVLVPLVWGVGLLASKVNALRSQIAQQEVQIREQALHLEELAQAAALAAASRSASGGATNTAAAYLQGPMQVAVAAGGLCVTAGLVAWKAAVLFNRANHASSSSSGQTRPPDGYQPTRCPSDGDACVVCLENQRDTLIEPCRHFAMCWPCSEHLLLNGGSGEGGRCPVCRGVMANIHFTFVA